MRHFGKIIVALVLGVAIAQAGCLNVQTNKSKPKETEHPSHYEGNNAYYYAPERDQSEVGPGNTDWNTELTK